AQQLALSFSDRIGFRQDSGRYRLNSGISVEPTHALNTAWAIFPVIQPRAKGHAGLGLELTLTAEQQRQLSQRQSYLVFKQHQWQRQSLWKMGGVVIAEQTDVIANDELAP